MTSEFSQSCGLKTDGTAVCWGNNSQGQATPPTGVKFVAISSGLAHTCAQRANGSVTCWGGLSGTFGE